MLGNHTKPKGALGRPETPKMYILNTMKLCKGDLMHKVWEWEVNSHAPLPGGDARDGRREGIIIIIIIIIIVMIIIIVLIMIIYTRYLMAVAIWELAEQTTSNCRQLACVRRFLLGTHPQKK